MQYGKRPRSLGLIPLELTGEVMYYLYLPITLACDDVIAVPQRLCSFLPLIRAVFQDIGPGRAYSDHVYLTVKSGYVGPGLSANRPGWHADGFGTKDLNYIWYDALPTVFSTTRFQDISPDHNESLLQFEQQAKHVDNLRIPPQRLLRLDPYVVHRVDEAPEWMFRTFVKISVSPHRYNLKGNSHNYMLNYGWKMYDRSLMRNDPTQAQRDYYEES